MRAVVIGPGRGGCGFVGPMLEASGYEIAFVGRDTGVVESLARQGGYRVRLVNGSAGSEATVRVRRSLASDSDRAPLEIARADLIATAVGAHQLQSIAPIVAEGLSRRLTPVNVLSFENLADAGTRLRAHVAEHLCSAHLERHGFAGALVTRAVTTRLGDPLGPAPLTFVGDPPAGFAVERRRLVATLPPMPGMTLVDDYTAAVRAKLYIFSAGHAAAAYLGRLDGHRYVHTAIRAPAIREIVIGAMAEGRRGVASRYGERYARIQGGLRAVVARFENAGLRDPVARVGRDPLRKLACDDRLIGAARLALDFGVDPTNLCLAAGAALRYSARADPSADILHAQLRESGVEATLSTVTGLPPGDPVIRRIVAAADRLASPA